MSKPRYAFAHKRTKKPVIAAIAVAVIAALMLGGAFAWTDFTQSKTNKFRGTYEADATLHDEFDGFNKNVFVENSGSNVIYVRVRLDEFMRVGTTQFDSKADARDKTTWTPHTWDGPTLADSGNADKGKFADYYEWNTTGWGGARDYTPGTPGMVYTTLGPDGKVLPEDVDFVSTGPASKPHHTADANEPMLMSEFKRLEEQDYDQMTPEDQAEWDSQVKAGCWILDDAPAKDGGAWAYWSLPLAPDTATNMLLQDVKLTHEPADDWIYRIDVKLQAVSLSDTDLWNDSAGTFGYKISDNAKLLIKAWQIWEQQQP
ncbi:MAG: hypothetical protein FWD65_03185 [Coriobacteriia bacterium]|nr:hypothetical protein [Coriobacteriia bacterium]